MNDVIIWTVILGSCVFAIGLISALASRRNSNPIWLQPEEITKPGWYWRLSEDQTEKIPLCFADGPDIHFFSHPFSFAKELGGTYQPIPDPVMPTR